MRNERSLRPRPRAWVWYFVFLTAMATAAVALPIVYNIGLQLRPADLAAARAHWAAAGTRNYDLQYQEKIEQSKSEWLIQVRDGRVTAVTCDGQELPASEYPNLTVDGQFAEIERGLQLDVAAGARRNYATATFDLGDGHPTHYVRRVRGTGDRLEWNVNLKRVGGDEKR